MAINLVKGQKIDLTKGNEGLTHLEVGLGWDINSAHAGKAFDLDCSVFVLSDDNSAIDEKNMIYYANLSNDAGVFHTGDNLTGDGDGDDEVINIHLPDLPETAEKIVFVVTIFNAEERKQNFGQVENAYIKVRNGATKEELLEFDLDEEFSAETSLKVAELYKYKNEWKFNAVGVGKIAILKDYCKEYGLEVV